MKSQTNFFIGIIFYLVILLFAQKANSQVSLSFTGGDVSKFGIGVDFFKERLNFDLKFYDKTFMDVGYEYTYFSNVFLIQGDMKYMMLNKEYYRLYSGISGYTDFDFYNFGLGLIFGIQIMPIAQFKNFSIFIQTNPINDDSADWHLNNEWGIKYTFTKNKN